MMDIELVEVAGGEDLAVVAGDFAIVESTAMHQQQLILDEPGEFKENPTICVGAFDYLNDDDGYQDLIGEISKQFAQDGMDVKSVALSPAGIINSDAFYP